ncbi:MAG: glycosyltransferase [Verrucomicrobiota bacterium]|nr:glycosyltransferase [Verrucomicrobiota bacterium]
MSRACPYFSHKMELKSIGRRGLQRSNSSLQRSNSKQTFTSAARELASDFPIIVHSHLAWDWVWQRPQQFHSRLSKKHPILFVEGPLVSDKIDTSKVALREVSDYPNIVVLQMELPAARFWSDGAWVDGERRRLVQSVLEGPLGRTFENPVQWFYDPMAVTAFLGHMDEAAVVYDCMDELSKFAGAHPELVRRERELLNAADVVFAGGPKMARAKRQFNSNCHSFGCGVDIKHFGKARHASTNIPADVAAFAGPVLGYIGVVDERVDYELLARLADHNREWNIVIVGPSTKVDPAQFPQRKNLHFLGGRDYSQLPAYAKAFDVCMMPFAKNEATEFINPTKALEYMATGTPIVSTDVEDVVLQFSEVVSIARNHKQFIAAAEQAIAQPNASRIAAGLKMAKNSSWESIVEQLDKHVQDVLAAEEAVASSSAA